MKKQKNIPELRFPEFEEDDYSKHLFANIFNFTTGKNIKQNEASPEFEIPCVRYGELYHMYSEVIYEVINRTNLDKNDLVFSKGNEILLPSAGEDPLDIGSASALTISNVAIGRTINILRPKMGSSYSQIFVSYYINQKLKRKISTLAKGVSISNVYNSDLKTLNIILPTLPEQQKIASFFTSIDKKITQLKQKHSLLEQYKKGVMQKIFAQEIRFKDGASATISIGNDNGYEDWEEKKLGEIALKKSSNISANTIESNFGDFIIYGASGVLKKIDFYEEEDPFISIVKDGAGVGRVLLCEAMSSVLATLDIIKPINTNIQYLFYVLQRFNFTKYITGSTIPHIYFSHYKNEDIQIPSLPEQTKIANFLSAIDIKIDNTQQQIDSAEQWKKGLLQRMFC